MYPFSLTFHKNQIDFISDWIGTSHGLITPHTPGPARRHALGQL
jgi:hypothetical protein